jgi:tetratricopeptide (TPR) repeat protein
MTLTTLGRLGEALSLYQLALRIDEAVFGPSHPYVAIDLTYEAETLLAMGRDEEARLLHHRALRIREEALGPDHPSTRQSRKFATAEGTAAVPERHPRQSRPKD